MALSAMEKWAIVDDDTGTNLSLLYDLLREQFDDPCDPWHEETLKWWDRCVFKSPYWCSHLFTIHISAKSSQTLGLMITTSRASGIWRAPQ